MAKAKSNSTALTKYDEQLARLAQSATEVQSSVGGAGNFLSIKSGVLSYQGIQIQENKMPVVILDAILEHQWYDLPYDPNNPTSPACYAFGREAKNMVPHEASALIQNEDCPSCPQMQFGSADRGKGKACKAVQRLGLITEGDLAQVETAELAYLKLPFYSTLEYAAYVRLLAEQYKKPPLAFLTEISVVSDPKSQFRVKFRMLNKIEDGEILGTLIELAKKCQSEIIAPYPERVIEEAPAPRRGAARAPAARVPARAPARVPQVGKAKPKAAAAVASVSAEGKPVGVGLRRAVKAPKY